MLRLGLVGAGPWGRNLIRTIRANAGAELAAVASSSPSTKDLLGSETKIFPHWRDLLAQASIDGLMVATPPDVQVEIVRAVLASPQNLPLLLEKPVAPSWKQAEALIELASQKPTPILVDHIHLFNPAYQALKQHVRMSKKSIASLQSAGGSQGPFRASTSALWDYGPHDLSLAIDLMGAIPKVLECTQEKLDSGELRENAPTFAANYNAICEFAPGIRYAFRVGNLFKTKTRLLEVDLGDEVVVFDDMAKHKTWVCSKSDNRTSPLDYAADMPLNACVEYFLRGLGGAPLGDLWGLDLGVDVVAALERCDGLIKAKAAGK